MLRRALFVIRQSRTQPLALTATLDLIKAHAAGAEITLTGIAVYDVEAMRRQMAQKVLGHTMSYAPEMADVDRTAREEFALLVRNFEESCERAGVMHEAEMREGSVADVLRAEALKHDIMVVPRDIAGGQDAVQKLLNPRLFPDIVAECPIPVLLGPSLPSEADLGPRTPIVVAYDGSEGSVRSLHSAASLGLLNGRDVEVVSISASEAAARDCAEKAAPLVSGHGGRMTLAPIMTSRHPSDVILDLVRNRPTLLVMGAFGARSITEMLFGSVTERLVERCPCAILMQH